jgi:hypothetical protein
MLKQSSRQKILRLCPVGGLKNSAVISGQTLSAFIEILKGENLVFPSFHEKHPSRLIILHLDNGYFEMVTVKSEGNIG